MSSAVAPWSRESMIEALMAKTGICWSAAAHAIDKHLAAAGVQPDPADTHREVQRANVSEKEEQAYVAKLFRGFGCKVYSLSQTRASKQTPGLPDLWVVHRERRVAFWFETKRHVGGSMSEPQKEFRLECTAAGVSHFVGDRRDAARALLQLGLACFDSSGPCGISPLAP